MLDSSDSPMFAAVYRENDEAAEPGIPIQRPFSCAGTRLDFPDQQDQASEAWVPFEGPVAIGWQ
jgi:hypothetical protein